MNTPHAKWNRSIALTLQNHEKMPDTSICSANTPPPACAKPGPKLFGFVSATMQRWGTEQSASSVFPVCSFGSACFEQPWSVCSAIWLLSMLLIASMMSISPALGHISSMPYVQNAGQTEQPKGMCKASMMISEPVP